MSHNVEQFTFEVYSVEGKDENALIFDINGHGLKYIDKFCLHYISEHIEVVRHRLACERSSKYFQMSLISAENNVCESEAGNNFCDVMTFVSLWPIRLYDRMKH